MHDPTPFLRAVGLVLLVWLASAPAAWSYQCRQPRTLAEELQQASAIFVGRVIAIEPLAAPGEAVDGDPARHRVVLVVERSWRGVQDMDVVPVEVPSAGGIGDGFCGVELTVGETYLVYAYGQEIRQTSIPVRGVGPCSRTRPLAQAAEDLAQLDQEREGGH